MLTRTNWDQSEGIPGLRVLEDFSLDRRTSVASGSWLSAEPSDAGDSMETDWMTDSLETGSTYSDR